MLKRYGITMGIERVGDEMFVSFKAVGKLTHEDYETITPVIDKALEGIKAPKVKMLFDASEFEGWELRAAWDDFNIGLKHGNSFEKIAIVGNKKWMEITVKIASWFIDAEVEVFDSVEKALEWLHS